MSFQTPARNSGGSDRPENPLLKRLKMSNEKLKSKATNRVLIFHVKPRTMVDPTEDGGLKPLQGLGFTVDGYFSKAMGDWWFKQSERSGESLLVRNKVKQSIEEFGCVKWHFAFCNSVTGELMHGTNGYPLKGLVWHFGNDEDLASAFTEEAIKELFMNTIIPTICSDMEIEDKSKPIWDELNSYKVVDTWSAFLSHKGSEAQQPQLWKMTMVGRNKPYANNGALLKASRNYLYSFVKPEEITQAYIQKYTLKREHLNPADADRLIPQIQQQLNATRLNNAQVPTQPTNNNGTTQRNNMVSPAPSQAEPKNTTNANRVLQYDNADNDKEQSADE